MGWHTINEQFEVVRSCKRGDKRREVRGRYEGGSTRG